MAAQYSFTELPDVPKDAISSVKFSPSGQSLLVGTWENSVYIYQRAGPDADFILQEQVPLESSALGVCWGADESTSFFVGLDQSVIKHVDGLDDVVLSTHTRASNKVAYSPEFNLLLSTSWDSTLHIHDPTTLSYFRLSLSQKPCALSISKDKAVVSMTERQIAVFSLSDLRIQLESSGVTLPDVPELQTVPRPWQLRESNLKFMTRDLACMPDGQGFATSSIEGRVSVEWFDPAREEEKYAFKCHRQTEQDLLPGTGQLGDVDVIYPVNSVCFNSAHGTFATGGGDGVVILWDAKTKRRIRAYPKFPACVAAMDFSPDGRFLAVGVCTGFEDGLEGEPAEDVGVWVRRLEEGEAKGKAAKEKVSKG